MTLWTFTVLAVLVGEVALLWFWLGPRIEPAVTRWLRRRAHSHAEYEAYVATMREPATARHPDQLVNPAWRDAHERWAELRDCPNPDSCDHLP